MLSWLEIIVLSTHCLICLDYILHIFLETIIVILFSMKNGEK